MFAHRWTQLQTLSCIQGKEEIPDTLEVKEPSSRKQERHSWLYSGRGWPVPGSVMHVWNFCASLHEGFKETVKVRDPGIF